MEGELATLIGQFHHIDADVLEKISPDEMAAILSSSDFHCDEEIIARQVRVWALFGNHGKAANIYKLIRWNCILPTAREQIKHRLPKQWRESPEALARQKPRSDIGYHYIAGGYYDPFYRSRNRNILRINRNFEAKEVTAMPDFVPGFATPSGMVIIEGNLYITFKTSYDINAKSHLASFSSAENTWRDLGPVPALGAYAFTEWKGGIVVTGGKKESSPAGRHNRMRTAPSEKVFFYEIESERWIPLDDLSTPRINPTVTVINGGLYCCGGLSPNPSDPDVVMSNPETEQLKELNDKWQKNDIHFNQHTHSIRYRNGLIFASHQNRNAEKLEIGEFDEENGVVHWKHSLDTAAGVQTCFIGEKLYVFGGISSEEASDQFIPFEVLKMAEKVSSIDLTNINDENAVIRLEDEDFQLSSKMFLFCASITKGPLY